MRGGRKGTNPILPEEGLKGGYTDILYFWRGEFGIQGREPRFNSDGETLREMWQLRKVCHNLRTLISYFST